jgi:hypothetical protein
VINLFLVLANVVESEVLFLFNPLASLIGRVCHVALVVFDAQLSRRFIQICIRH